MSSLSATIKHASIAAGVVPQSSWSFKPTAPASTISFKPDPLWSDVLPLPVNPKFMGNVSVLCNIIFICSGAGVQVVAHVPVAGPVPPPNKVVKPLAIASVKICGQIKCTCVSKPPAVTIKPSAEMTSVFTPTTIPGVTFSMTSGLPALPMPTIIPSLIPRSHLNIPV
jgi:hypothetical protein